MPFLLVSDYVIVSLDITQYVTIHYADFFFFPSIIDRNGKIMGDTKKWQNCLHGEKGSLSVYSILVDKG